MTSILQLPEEVIPKILVHLPLLDRKSARRACQTFCKASLAPEVARNQIITVVHSFRCNTVREMVSSAPADYKIYHLRVLEVRYTVDTFDPEISHFFSHFGDRIDSLEMINCTISETVLQNILFQCPNLTCLSILGCYGMRMKIDSAAAATAAATAASTSTSATAANMVAESVVEWPPLALSGLRSVCIAKPDNKELVANVFTVLNKCSRLNLTRLCLQRFEPYPFSADKFRLDVSECVAMFLNGNATSSCVSLTLDKSTFFLWPVMKVKVQLKEIDMSGMSDSDFLDVKNVCRTILKHLKLSLTPSDLPGAVSDFTGLTNLDVHLAGIVDFETLAAFLSNLTSMSSLRHLDVIVLNQHTAAQSTGFPVPGQMQTNSSLRTLRLTGFQFPASIFAELLRCFPNLEDLTLFACSELFDNSDATAAGDHASVTGKPGEAIGGHGPTPGERVKDSRGLGLAAVVPADRPLPLLAKLKSLRFQSINWDNRVLKRLPNLERLYFEKCVLSDRVFSGAYLPKLRSLHVNKCSTRLIRNLAMRAPNIETLTLTNCHIAKFSLSDVTLPNVAHLSLVFNGYCESGWLSLEELISTVIRAVPNVRTATLCLRRDHKGQEATPVCMGDKLRSLTLRGAWGRQTIIALAASSPGLQQLTLDPGVMLDQDVALLRATNPHLCIMWSREKLLQPFNQATRHLELMN